MYHALCIDAANGSIIWDKELFSEDRALGTAKHDKNSRASATPVVEGDRLYVHFGNQGIACLTTEGEPIWSNRNLRYEPVHGNGGSPIILDDKLIFSCDGGDTAFVVALDKATGRQVWRTERGVQSQSPFSFSTPLAVEVDGRTQVVSAGSGAVYGYDPANGRVIWGVGYGSGFSVVPQPVHVDGLVYVCTGFMRPSLLAIRPAGARGDVTQSAMAWSTNRAAPLTPTPVASGGNLFMVSDQGVASCLDAATGEVRWQQRIGNNYSASPVIGDGRVYFPSEEGEVVVVAASAEFRELARNTVGERIFATPALVDGAVYLRTDSALHRIGPVGSAN
jgi:outer membrane protein assembly factor BamB